MKRFFPGCLIIFLLINSCGPKHFAPIQLNVYNYGMEGSKQGEQKEMKQLLKPYADSVNSSMNNEIGMLEASLTKSWPECSLGFFMTDAYFERATLKFGKKVDLAVMNLGGIRLGSIEPGPISKGKIYELMPFDNLMVLIELKGAQLQLFFDYIAGRGGWPVSGASYKIQNKKAIEVMVGGDAINPEKQYVIATSDYVANGGEENSLLKGIAQLNIGYLQRDALLEYVMEHKIIAKPTGERVIKLDD